MKRLALMLALALPLAAAAQDVAAPQLQEDPRAARFNDVERGFFMGFEAGYLGLQNVPVADTVKYKYVGSDHGGTAGGIQVGLTLGVDLGTRVSVALFGQGGSQKADASYGAFSLYAGGVDLKVAILGARDRNDWERFFLYVHGRGGIATSFPKGLFGTTDVIAQGGPGIEYFTRLRHFSVGLATDVVYATTAKTTGFAIYPTVRYTF